MPSEIMGHGSKKLRIDFHVHLGLYTETRPWVTEWLKQTHPVGYQEYINRYNNPDEFRRG